MNKRISIILTCALIALAVISVAVVAAEGLPEELTEWQVALATLLGSVVGVPITQFLKKILPDAISSRLMTYIAYVAAFIVALIVFLITGGLGTLFSNPWLLITEGSAVFGLTTLAYKTVRERLNLGRA